MATARPTAGPEQPLTALDKTLYAAGHFGVSVLGFGLVASVRTFYHPPPEAQAAGEAIYVATRTLMGLAIALGRVTDAVNDPLIGFLSDRLRSRWGRRKPFMVAGIVPFIALYMAIWYPPVASTSVLNFVYAAVVLVLLFVAFTVYAGPYLALLPEIASSERERVNLASWQALFNIGGIVVGSALGALLIPHIGYAQTGLVLAAIAFVSLWLPCFGPRERIGRDSQPSAYGFRRALLLTLRNRPFLVYLAAYLAFWTGLLVLIANLDEIGQELLGLRKGEGLYLAAATLVAGIACLPLARGLAGRRGTKRAMAISMAAFGAVGLLLGTVGLLGDERFALWHMCALCILAGPAVAGLFAIPYVILAAITDDDERTSGERREAMFFGVQGLVLKAGFGLAPLIGGLLLDYLGGAATQPLGLHLTGPAGAVIALAGLVVFLRFPADLSAPASQPAASAS